MSPGKIAVSVVAPFALNNALRSTPVFLEIAYHESPACTVYVPPVVGGVSTGVSVGVGAGVSAGVGTGVGSDGSTGVGSGVSTGVGVGVGSGSAG